MQADFRVLIRVAGSVDIGLLVRLSMEQFKQSVLSNCA